MEAHKTRGCIPLVMSLLIASVAVRGEDAEEYPSALVPLISLLAGSAESDAHCPATGPVCYNCTTAPICVSLPNGKSLLLGSYNCSEQNPNEPYCNNGVCSATTSQNCSHEFECTSEGNFPDPDDCQKFHRCDGNLSATTYTCAANYVYAPASNNCVRKKVATDCATIKCKYAVPVEYVVYPKDPSLYGICIRDQRTVVFKCGDGEEFDTKASQCKFVCKKEGVFPADRCRKFYECVYVGFDKHNIVEGECPVGTKFDADVGGCKTGSCDS